MVLLDSSALLACFETGVKFMEEVTDLTQGRAVFNLPFETVVELRMLGTGRPKLAGMAELALKTARCFRTLPPTGMGCDDALVYLAKTYKAAVATADRVLRRRLRALGITVFYPAGEKRIIGEGWFEEVKRIV